MPGAPIRSVWRAIATFVNLTYAALLLTLSGWIARTFGLIGIVAVLALVALIGLGCARLIPPAPPAATHAGIVEGGWTTNRPAIGGALALLCLYAGHTTLWSFQERMGLAVGLDRTQVGVLLEVSVLGAIRRGPAVDDRRATLRPARTQRAGLCRA